MSNTIATAGDRGWSHLRRTSLHNPPAHAL